MLLKDNEQSFLTGKEPFVTVEIQSKSDDHALSTIRFEPRHEGFVGIPHGGVGMGLCLDSWRNVGVPNYPINAKFKFGGSGIVIGDEAIFEIQREKSSPDGLDMKIIKIGDRKPYLRAEIRSVDLVPPPKAQLKNPQVSRKLPYYKNCFVCGHARNEPGLQRRFRFDQMESDIKVTVSWGLNSEDFDRAASFLIAKDELHPAALISIFDENTAWAGFMLTKSAGLSVRLDFTLLRPVGRYEKLIFVGEPLGIRGNPASPRFFTAQGTIYAFNGAGLETVAYGGGEWIIMQQYTEQIKKNLIPENDWEWIFI
jgi:hypothetical protein